MGWEAAQTDRQEVGGGHRVILEVRSIFRASAKILAQKMTYKPTQFSASVCCFKYLVVKSQKLEHLHTVSPHSLL